MTRSPALWTIGALVAVDADRGTAKPLDLQVGLKVYTPVVTTSLKIKSVAELSGFTPATLRYYEQIGLLPATDRTASGYRLYDDRVVDRLAFIARAKGLGCSLEEIADLLIAWDGGQCGPVQDRLRAVVADKVSSAHRQIIELMTLTSELQHAAAGLERHRPAGPCDDSCGCVTETNHAQPQTVSLTSKAATSNEGVPIACTLDSGAIGQQLHDWQRVCDHVEHREPIDNGVRLVLARAVPIDAVAQLMVAEHDCCRFFEFALVVDGRGVALEVRAPADAQPLVDSIFGVPA
jgi:MerR family transcriptional regulator, copper efflux regulator